jgi:hypothetical protein
MADAAVESEAVAIPGSTEPARPFAAFKYGRLKTVKSGIASGGEATYSCADNDYLRHFNPPLSRAS